MRQYNASKRILVTGGAGFLGIPPERPPDRRRARTCFAPTTSSPAAQAQRRPPARHTALRADAPRRDVPALCRGRRDLQPGLPGLADPLPARPGADHQDQRARRDQHARSRQAPRAHDLSGLDQRGLWRPRPSTRRPRTTGATSIRSASASCYDEGKRCAETLFFDYYRQHQPRMRRCGTELRLPTDAAGRAPSPGLGATSLRPTTRDVQESAHRRTRRAPALPAPNTPDA